MQRTEKVALNLYIIACQLGIKYISIFKWFILKYFEVVTWHTTGTYQLETQ